TDPALEISCDRIGACQSKEHTEDHERHSLPDDHPEHVRSIRSERHANANLVRALRDCICEHAKQSDRRELLGQQSKQRQQLREQAFHAKCFVSLLNLRHNVQHRQVGIDVPNNRPYTRYYRRWIAGSAHFKYCVTHRAVLTIRAVRSRWHFIALARILRISRDADDLELIRLRIVVSATLSNRVLIGEELVREGLIDHDNLR